ncbi:MAG: Integral rane sensor signal transduction histidine kinase [Chthoniobacteraceae bacterium]|nr:Integral rane sensor signal transduction histidine kinase [Chthoniobacteraceae bacterium]
MRKNVAIFLLAVLLPSVVLGWLALRNAQEQQIIIERRTAELYQSEVDNAAAGVRAIIDEQRRGFAESVRRLLSTRPPEQLAKNFAPALIDAWPRKAVGFAIGADGRIVSPTAKDAGSNADWKRFLWDNGQFLCNQMAVMVFPVSVDDLNRPDQYRKKASQEQQSVLVMSKKSAAPSVPAPLKEQKSEAPPSERASNALSKEASSPQKNEQDSEKQPDAMVRNVAPQQMLALSDRAAYSQLNWATTGFKALTTEAKEGMVTRFVQDRLEMILWLRPEQAPELIFGCLVEADSLRDLWALALPEPVTAKKGEGPEFIVTLLDDKARAVISAPAGVGGRDWKRPFVASEIGEALPHWEAALYLPHPEQLQESAKKVRRTLYLLIGTALSAIACGGWLVVADARRQLLLAQKKTDFVSNVSHELKTPLTSIRMFAELMQSGRAEPARHAQYLRIIMVESERLTRLINNVLDFARLERRQKQFDRIRFDLHRTLERIWENHELHLRESGFLTSWKDSPEPYPVHGDEDALAQVLVNLLSNAEKYSGAQKEVELHSYIDGETVCVSVLDRGTGVPEGEEQKIFEAFYRAHDSLSSGIQGSGLGLTLAQRHAREHAGEILYQARAGGGSIFTLRLPLLS